MESNRRNTCAIEIFARDDWLEWAAPEPDLSEANPVGEFTVVPDDSGEKATPLEDPGPPPPPIPLPGMEPDIEAKWDPADGVCVRNFGDESDCADCCEPDCSEEKGEGAGFGLLPERPLLELRTAENDDGVEAPGPTSKPREDVEVAVEEERLVARGVNPRRMPDCDEDRPQAPISVLVEEGLSVPEAIDDWAEG